MRPASASHPTPLVIERRSASDPLLTRLAAADDAAITHVYRLYRAEVQAYAYRMLGDAAAAEDVVHDTFVALPAAAARFRGDASLRSFVFAIAINHCRRRLRSATRQRRALARMEHTVPPDTPDGEARRRRLAAALRRGLETLSVEHREAFILCVVEERSSSEVSALVGVPEGTVRTRVFHARAKLRAFLEGVDAERRPKPR